MAISIDQIEVTSFATTLEPYDLSPSQQLTPPVKNCYSPLCIPTDLPEQCPETTVQTGVGAA